MFEMQGYDGIKRIHQVNGTDIYRAVRKSDNTPVIIKMPGSEYQDLAIIAGFKHEFIINQKINSKNIVKIYGIEPINNTLALIEEDFGSIPLLDAINLKKPDLREFLVLSINIAESLKDIHKCNIVHNNINPCSIMINPETNIVKITGFATAAVLSNESRSIESIQRIKEDFQYISPEQTGRMNRQVDYRTDFYSLGVTLYQVLLGRLPFEVQDELGFIYCHLAKKPVPPHELNPDIPSVISALLMKLLEKSAEDRYQSAAGLISDLTKCLDQLQKNGAIEPFELGTDDITDKFQIPQKLYSREEEFNLLLAAFERISTGGKEVLLVTGYTGVGKSSLIYEINKPITKGNGYFISGKFDQFQHDIPYSALVQAFKELARQILTQSEEQVEAWKQQLLKILGANGRVITEVIPEIELIIGKQPALIELPPEETKNRFNMVFQKFVRVFGAAEHPLVIFLDDLQWADLSSLKLIELLLNDFEIKHLLFIGAYRDNEVPETHPLIFTLNNLRHENITVNSLLLKPLSLIHVRQLLAEAFKHGFEEVFELAELCLLKTEGNPFFLNQFLLSLYRDNLINFDFDQRQWQLDLPGIKKTGIADNVVDLITGRIRRLSPDAQEVLKMAACIGNKFDLKTLSIIREKTFQETDNDLREALQEGILSSVGDFYVDLESQIETKRFTFLHDRIQQAAYSLITEGERPKVHLSIGRLMLTGIDWRQNEEKLLDILNHINLGLDLIEDTTEKEVIAELELLAGRKSKKTTAYMAAYQYFKAGISLMGEYGWEACYDLTFALFVETGEAACLASLFPEVEYFTDTAIRKSKNVLDKVKAYEVKIAGYSAQNKVKKTIETGLEILQQLGFDLPKNPGKWDIIRALIKTKVSLSRKTPESLLNMAPMTDPRSQSATRIIFAIAQSAYKGNPDFFVFMALKAFELCIKYGNAEVSCIIYVSVGSILCEIGEIDLGCQLGELSLKLLDKFATCNYRVQTTVLYNAFIAILNRRLHEILPSFIDNYVKEMETGDFNYACMDAFVYSYYSFHAGRELTLLENKMSQLTESIIKTKYREFLHPQLIFHQTILNLMGLSDDPAQLNGKAYHQDQMLPLHFKENDLNPVGFFYSCALMLYFIFGEYDRAVETGILAKKYLGGIRGTLTTYYVYFYDSLARLAIIGKLPLNKRFQTLRVVTANQLKMKKWAYHAPMNFSQKYSLVEAELARVFNKDRRAMVYYDKAIGQAAVNGYIQEEAHANELAARFHLSRGNEKLAGFYMNEARSCYSRWGAAAKVRQLENQYPQLLQPENAKKSYFDRLDSLKAPDLSSETVIMEKLDLVTIKKASQAISGEIVLEDLLKRLIEIILENAGAQRVLLMLKKDDALYIEASGNMDQNRKIDVMQREPVQDNIEIPESIINYVSRSKESIVLDNASESGQFLSDPYIQRNSPKSVLCMPILNQGELKGLLYLENNLADGAFTEDRIIILNILSSQLAISIENALFYSQLDDLINKRTKGLSEALDSFNKTRSRLIEPEKMAAFGQLVAGVAQEINTPHLKNLYSLQNTISELKSNLIHPLELENNNRILSKREAEVAELLCKRLSMSEIAVKLALSPRTVETYVENIKEKLGVRTKRELILKLAGKEEFKNIS